MEIEAQVADSLAALLRSPRISRVGLLDRLVALTLSGIDLIDGLAGLVQRSQQARFRCRRRQDLRWWCQSATREQADQKAAANKGRP